MSAILITNILINNPKDYFTEPIKMRFDLEILQSLSREFEFRVVYIGSPDDSDKDQVLQLIKIKPHPVGARPLLLTSGVHTFEILINPPDHTKIPPNDLLGPTVLMISCHYRFQEFFRCSYFVFNGYYDVGSERGSNARTKSRRTAETRFKSRKS